MRYALAILLLAGCTAPKPQPVDFVPAISVAVGVAEVTGDVAPPSPSPSPGTCDNCGGTGKVGDGTVMVPCGACGGDGKIEGQPVETPLVDKLLPKKTDAGKDAAPAIADGTRTADGFFKFSAARNAWIPVDYGHPHYDFNNAPVTVEHLIREHGHARSSAEKWTRAEIEVAHANSHWWEKQQAVTQAPVVRKQVTTGTAWCPTGNCPNTNIRTGLFGRWR